MLESVLTVTDSLIACRQRYRTGVPVSLGHPLVHLTPLDTARQVCRNSRLTVDSAPSVCRERAQGLAVRYFSGYLETDPAPGQERLTGADASHAWFSVYVPDAGWLDFDPTNHQVPLDRHITLAWGRDHADVAPLKGVLYGGGAHTLAVAVTVERLEEDPTAAGTSY